MKDLQLSDTVVVAGETRMLPQGWRWVRLGEVCELRTGGTPSKSDLGNFGGDIRWLVSGDIHQGEVNDCVGRITTKGMASSNARLLPPDCVLIALNGQGKTRGTVALLCTEATCNQSLVAMIPRDRNELLPSFLLYQLQMRYHELRDLTGDRHRSGLSMRILERLEVIVAPIQEQKRITGVLKEQMAAVEQAQSIAEAQLEAAKMLPAAYLRAVFNSTEAQRWPRKRLGEVCDIQLGKMLSPLSKTGARSRSYLRNANVQWGSFDLSDVAEMDFTEEEETKFALRPGDLLVCEGGEPGRAAVWNGEIAPCYFQKALHRLRPINGTVNPFFIMYRLRIGAFRGEFIQSHAKTTIAHLPTVRLYELPIEVPPLAEQHRIASRLTEQMAAVEQTHKTLEAQLTTINALPAALLGRAFSGVL